MSVCFLQTDARYRRFLAERPGLWREVGAFDDLMALSALSALRAERQALGLPLFSSPQMISRSKKRSRSGQSVGGMGR